MKDLDFFIKINIDHKEAKVNLASLKESFSSFVKEVKKPLGQIESFIHLKKEIKSTEDEFAKIQHTINNLAKEIKNTESPSKQLVAHFEQAKEKARELKIKLKEQKQSLAELRKELNSSGISTRKLASAQSNLITRLKEAKKAFEEEAKVAKARDVLGIKPHSEIFNEINKLKNAYRELGRSGKLSFHELAQAKVKLNQQIKELEASTNGWTHALTMARAELMEIGVFLAGVWGSISGAIRFESAMADVRKTVNSTKEQFKYLRKDILELGRVIPLSYQEIAKIAALGGQLGIPVQDIKEFTEIVAKMATAFDMTAEEAGTAIGKLKNVFGLSIDEITSFGDAINRLGNTTAAREKDIINVLLRIGGSARQFGITKEQAAALADAMLALGKTPEVAATSINAFLNRLQTLETLTPKAKQALTVLGYTTEILARQIRKNPQKAIIEFLNSLKKLDKETRTLVITEIFGREFQDDIAVLINGIESYKKALAEVSDRARFAGAMQREFSERARTTKNQFQLLKNSIVEIGIELGSVFLPALVFIVKVFKNMATLIGDIAKVNPHLASFVVTLTSLALLGPPLARLFDILKLGIAGLGSLSVLQNLTSQVGILKAEITSFGMALSTVSAIFASAFVGWNIGKVLADIKIGKRAIGDWGAYFMAWIMDIVAGLKMIGGLWMDLYSFNWGNFKNRLNAFKEELEINKKVREMALKGENDIQREKGETIHKIREEIREEQRKSRLEQELLRYQTELTRLEAKKKLMAQETLKKEIKGIKTTITLLEEKKKKIISLIDESLKKEQEYTEEIKRQQQAILSTKETTEEKIREIRRRYMSEAQLEADREKEYHEKMEKARKAFFEENYNLALKYAKQAQDIATAFKEQERAIEGVKKSGELLKDIHEKIKEKAEESLTTQQQKTKELQKDMSSLEKKLSDYHAKLKKVNSELKKIIDKPTIATIDANIEKAKQKIKEIKEKLASIKDKKVTVTIEQKTIETHKQGGFVGLFKGGKLPGYGGGDKIRALLEAGEFVIRKEAVKKYGAGLLTTINNLKFRLPAIAVPVKRDNVQKFDTSIYRKFEISMDRDIKIEGFAIKDVIDEFERKLRRRSLCGQL